MNTTSAGLPITKTTMLFNGPSAKSARSALGQPRALDTIVWGGLVAGALDIVDSIIAFGLLGMKPIRVLQFISTGLIGPEAFRGGISTAALGGVLQFSVAFAVAAVYYAAARSVPILVRKPVVFGLAFGASVYLVMNYVVLPFSGASRSDFPFGLLLHRFIAHALVCRFTDRTLRAPLGQGAVLTISIS
jgi:hypothetical protein